MNEVNIDSLSGEELKAQAKVLGITHAANISDEKLRERIKSVLGESGQDNPDANDQNPDAASAPSAEEAKADLKKKIVVMIPKTELDKQPVYVGINGKSYRIRRGEKVEVPQAVANVLRDAKQTVFDPDKKEWTEVPSYPVQILG